MTRNRATAFGTATILGLAACAGCVLRQEKIAIGRDGSAVIELEISGTPEELARGDALPSAQGGWDVERRTDWDKDEEKTVLTTKRSFAPGEALPATFASPTDPNTDLYLSFPTEVRVEQRPDGMYYFFQRVYAPRNWVYVQYWQDVFFNKDVQKLGDKPVEQLTREERRSLIQAFASVEAFKQAELTKAALAECAPELPIENRLAARQALLDVYENYGLLDRGLRLNIFDKDDEPVYAIMNRCDLPTEDARNACYEAEASRLLGEAHSALLAKLHDDIGFGVVQLARFELAYHRALRRYEITNQLGGQQFEVTLEIPGRIVAHNGDEATFDEESGMSGVTWRFEGKAFRDRTHELTVVSKMADESDPKVRRPVDGDGR